MYYPIDENTARLSHQMMSMSDYKEGSATAGYRAAVDEATALVERQKQKVSPFYHEKLDTLLDRYARRLAKWTNDHNRNGASCPSVLVCGWANFPTKKKNRQNAREDALWKEYDEIKGILSKIKSVGTGPFNPTDPHAREMWTDELQSLQATLDRGKAMNAYYRKHKTMKGFPDMSDETAAKMDDAIKRALPHAQIPVPSFQLASLRGKIKRTQENLAKLDSMEQHKDDTANTLEFDGGKIFLNMEANRLQILFDEIPDEETRAALKSHGFKWSRKNEAWQRQLTQNAVYDAKRILGITDVKPSPGEISPSAPPAIIRCCDCEYSRPQYSIFGEERFECVTCTLLNCGVKSFSVSRYCPLLRNGATPDQSAPPTTPEEAPPPDLPIAADGQALFPLA